MVEIYKTIEISQVNDCFKNWFLKYLEHNWGKLPTSQKLLLYNIDRIATLGFPKFKFTQLTIEDIKVLSFMQQVFLFLNLKKDKHMINDVAFQYLNSLVKKTINYKFTHVDEPLYEKKENEVNANFESIITYTHIINYISLNKSQCAFKLSELNVVYLENTMINAYNKQDLMVGNAILRTLHCHQTGSKVSIKNALNHLLCQQDPLGFFGFMKDLIENPIAFFEFNFDYLWTINEIQTHMNIYNERGV